MTVVESRNELYNINQGNANIKILKTTERVLRTLRI